MKRKLEECADQIDSSIFGSAVYTAADLVCQAEQKACKGFSYCYNSVQQKIPDKDLSRILKGVGLIAVRAGKVTGAVALAAISAPFCGAVVGVAGEAAAGITAAAGGGDIAQGLQEIMCGWNGDSESESYNLVRDTLYSGNETAYQISTVTAAVCGGVGKWLGTRAAKAAEAAAKKAAEEAAGLADETAEAAAKTAAKEAGEAAEEAVKQSTKDALEDAAGETAIENLDGIEGIGKSGKYSLSNVEARKWYLEQEAKIPDMIDKSLPLEEQAKQAFNLRNQFRTQARELMEDRATAESLYKTDPNLAWEEIVRKQRAKGLEGDDIYKAIIESSQRSRKSVNKSLGLE